MSDVKLLKQIGQGAFGKVYLGDKNGSRVAVKVIKLTGSNRKIAQDAFKEGKMLEMLQHPNIVGCQGFQCLKKGEVTELHIVMEYCGGGDLYSTIRRRKTKGQYFPEEKVIGWFVDVTRALEYLHSMGAVHRDIKPLNILLHEDGTIKLGDFGLAKILRTRTDKQASVIGTVIYASPELHFRSICDQKGDMWSLGCTLYELVRLEPAFRNAGEMTKFVHKGMSLRPIPAVFSERMKMIINSLLQVDPKERPSATSLIETLQNPQLKLSKDKVDARGKNNDGDEGKNDGRKEGNRREENVMQEEKRANCKKGNRILHEDEESFEVEGPRGACGGASKHEKGGSPGRENAVKVKVKNINCRKGNEKNKIGKEYAKGKVVNDRAKHREVNPRRNLRRKLQEDRDINDKSSGGDNQVDINNNSAQDGKGSGDLLVADKQIEKGPNGMQRKVAKGHRRSPFDIRGFDDPRFPFCNLREVQVNLIRIGGPSVKLLRGVPNGNGK